MYADFICPQSSSIGVNWREIEIDGTSSYRVGHCLLWAEHTISWDDECMYADDEFESKMWHIGARHFLFY